ncbi:MAG: hypothetical protein P8074_07060 [Anaerolineales bacterium]|jgi:hypothetical protein
MTGNKSRDSSQDSGSGGTFRAGRDIRAGRDLAGRDLAGRDLAGRDITHQQDSAQLIEALNNWRDAMNARIEAQSGFSQDEKQDLQDQVDKIQNEAAKGEQADPSRLEKLVNTLAVMAPDIFEVAVATLANPLAGIGLVMKKIGDKARVEAQSV